MLHPIAHLKSFFQIRRHFGNPFLIVLFRLGIIKAPYFLHRIQKGPHRYALLARPTTTSMADLFVLREVLVDETYKEILPLLGGRNVRLLDIGANLGSFTIWLQQSVGVREAYCFEPEEDSFRLLNFNLSLNNCPTAKAIQCAVGGKARTVKLALKKDSPGGTSIYADTEGASDARSIPVIAFGDWLRQIEGDFDLLKMDCEGAEWEILDTTDPRLFGRFRVFVAEVHADPEKSRPVAEFKRAVENLGFRTVRWDDKTHGLYVGVRNTPAAS